MAPAKRRSVQGNERAAKASKTDLHVPVTALMQEQVQRFDKWLCRAQLCRIIKHACLNVSVMWLGQKSMQSIRAWTSTLRQSLGQRPALSCEACVFFFKCVVRINC